MIGLGHTQQIGDNQQRKGLAVRRGELATSIGDKLVDQFVGEVPHELFVLLEPLRGEQPVEQRAVRRVPGRIKRDEVLTHRELIAVGLNEL
jgi:hypothetical protein